MLLDLKFKLQTRDGPIRYYQSVSADIQISDIGIGHIKVVSCHLYYSILETHDGMTGSHVGAKFFCPLVRVNSYNMYMWVTT